MDLNNKHSKVFYGWYIVGACLLITIYTGGVVHLGFTAVFEPIAEEFGWSYATISLASSLRGFEMSLLAPVTGLFVDRWGPRKLIFGGSILICLGFLLLSRVSSLGMFYVAFALMAIGMSTCANTVLMTAVVNWFRKRVGVAISIVSSGFGFSGLIIPVVTKLVDVLQWRMAMVVFGLGMLVIVSPLSLVLRHKPEHYGYQPDGEERDAVEISEVQSSRTSIEVSTSTKQALRKRAFWHVAIASVCHLFLIGAITTHIMPYLGSLGFTRSLSSLVALIVPVATIGGRLGGGWLGDRLGNKQVFSTSLALMTIGTILFGYITTERMWLLVPFIITLSLGWGCGVTARTALIREYFGRGSFGAIHGFLSGIMMLGAVTGAPLAGWIFDTWGTYQGAWISFGAITIMGTFFALAIPSSHGTIRRLG
ncbi:MFS transporter [Chloroflexota bacterium]